MLKLNILQYAQSGTLLNREQGKAVEIKPEDMRAAALSFKVADGLLPTEKLINAESYQVTLQMLMSSPEAQNQFDVISFMVYYLKSMGAKDLDQFKFSPEQVQARQQQQLQMMQAQSMAHSSGHAVAQHHNPVAQQ
jgi:hypothetical protein